MARVVVKGLAKLEINLAKLPKNLKIYSKEIVDASANEIKRRARIRLALTSDWSERLKKNLIVFPLERSDDNYKVVCGVFPPLRYAAAQEYGFSKHLVLPDWDTGSGLTFGDWLRSHGKMRAPIYVEKPSRPEGYYFGPSVRSVKRDLPRISRRAISQAIKKSGFK